jgi:hypothetical protein
MADDETTISTTTRVAIEVPVAMDRLYAESARAGFGVPWNHPSVVSPMGTPKPKGGRRPTKADQEVLMQENIELYRRLIHELYEQKDHLIRELEELKEHCAQSSMVSVVVFGSGNDLNVCAVTNGNEEGIDLFSRMRNFFDQNRELCRQRRIHWNVVEDIPINKIHQAPVGLK